MRSVLPFVVLVSLITAASSLAACGATSAESRPADAGAPPDPTEAGPPAVAGALPCDVEKLLVDKCQKCHANPPQFGAPMPLVTLADLHAAASTEPTKKVYELVAKRVADESGPMPPYPNDPLAKTDVAVFGAWAAAGAPAGTVADCATKPPDPKPGVKCKPDLPIGAAAPFTMDGASGDEYVCYGVELSRATPTHVTGFVPRIDNRKIVHHVVLFEADSAYPTTPTKCQASGSLQWRMVTGWAPGGDEGFEMPPEAGFPLKTDGAGKTHYVVQMHYSNPLALTGQVDSSGYDLCTAPPRKYEADILAFGTQQIDMKAGMASYEKVCSITVPQQLSGIHLIAAMPHMHKLGTEMSTGLFAGGPTGAASDLGTVTSYSFNTQAWLGIKGPGGQAGVVTQTNDVIKTRCAWKNSTGADVRFGENTADEMCYSFTVYYPKITTPAWSWAGPAIASQCQ